MTAPTIPTYGTVCEFDDCKGLAKYTVEVIGPPTPGSTAIATVPLAVCPLHSYKEMRK